MPRDRILKSVPEWLPEAKIYAEFQETFTPPSAARMLYLAFETLIRFCKAKRKDEGLPFDLSEKHLKLLSG
ncbi:MAG: hypothetical protein UT34_C0002G0021 [candidate division WS6 bacterium GW2011_GWF2_39_15]|uniref:Uncharacterized protein n=1 Tax=candidate division WS6 bacterium GW2011_GWF2_39_15 TaxID=1619100 RepID=A0A0G0MN49_9BACT|nr:MAG: hypothetical protein UT34_C0002G0021 [candidate division WS6 bacterium GW2011_GWF2_39_15]